MKLVYCPECGDVFALRRQVRKCWCGKSAGLYKTDNLHAVIGGAAVPLGFDNTSFALSLANRPASGLGQRFTAFVIPEECERVSVLGKPSKNPAEESWLPGVTAEEAVENIRAVGRMLSEKDPVDDGVILSKAGEPVVDGAGDEKDTEIPPRGPWYIKNPDWGPTEEWFDEMAQRIVSKWQA